MISKERLLLTADGKVVHEGDPRGVKLLVAAGSELSPTDIQLFRVPLKPGGQEIDVLPMETAEPGPGPTPPKMTTVAGKKAEKAEAPGGDKAKTGADEYPADFPGRKVFIAAKVSPADLRTMSAQPDFRAKLIAMNGIAEATADKVIEALPKLSAGAESAPSAAPAGEANVAPTGAEAKVEDERPGLSIAEATKDIAGSGHGR